MKKLSLFFLRFSGFCSRYKIIKYCKLVSTITLQLLFRVFFSTVTTISFIKYRIFCSIFDTWKTVSKFKAETFLLLYKALTEKRILINTIDKINNTIQSESKKSFTLCCWYGIRRVLY